jgi:transcriptional regulator with XRE-family HTH domain
MNGPPSAQEIRRYRKSLGESQKSFGKRFGVKRLTVGNWERGTVPNSKHLPPLTQEMNERGKAKGEEGTYQLILPFDQPISLELKMSPQKAETIHFEVRFKRTAS